MRPTGKVWYRFCTLPDDLPSLRSSIPNLMQCYIPRLKGDVFFNQTKKYLQTVIFFQRSVMKTKKKNLLTLSLWKKDLSALLKEHLDDKFFFPGGKQISKGSETGDLSGTTARWHFYPGPANKICDRRDAPLQTDTITLKSLSNENHSHIIRIPAGGDILSLL